MDLTKAPAWAVPIAVLVTVAVIFGYATVREERMQNLYSNKHLLKVGEELPPLWLYYNTSDVNSRFWSDFGGRSTRALNMPFLNLCYDTIAKHNGEMYRIEVIGGLSDLALRLGGWNALPAPLQNPLASVNEAELNWIRATVLAKYGGLWVQPAPVCMKPFGLLPDNKTVFFGTNPTDNVSGPLGTAVPSLRAIWSPSPGHPVFTAWAQRAFIRLDSTNGGHQIRDDQKSDFVELAGGRPDVVIRPWEELSRKGTSAKPIQLEDLLAAGQEGVIPFEVPCDAVYCPFPWKDLCDRRMFGWFLRMDEDQILAADLAVSQLLRISLGI